MKTCKRNFMKKVMIHLLATFIGVSFFISSCNNEPKITELMVLVKSGGTYFANVTVKLYNSSEDRTNDVVLKTAFTPPTNAETVGAKFYDLPEKTYYLKVEFEDGINKYAGNAEIYVTAGEQTVYTMEVTKSPTGNLKVFVRKDLPSGVYMGGATVYLYKSEADRTANNIFMENQTGTDNPQVNGATFSYLSPMKYYLKATFNLSGDDYEGLGEYFVPINTTSSYHIVCTKK